MKICVVFLIVVASFTSAFAAKGTVTNRVRGCDYFLVAVEGSSDFVLMEWYRGYDPDRGDSVVGKFDSFGFTDVYFGDKESHVWIEDYGMKKSNALEKLFDKCD